MIFSKGDSMDRQEFWQLMEWSLAKSHNNQQVQENLVIEKLLTYTPSQIIDFEVILRQLLNEANEYTVAAAETDQSRVIQNRERDLDADARGESVRRGYGIGDVAVRVGHRSGSVIGQKRHVHGDHVGDEQIVRTRPISAPGRVELLSRSDHRGEGVGRIEDIPVEAEAVASRGGVIGGVEDRILDETRATGIAGGIGAVGILQGG